MEKCNICNSLVKKILSLGSNKSVTSLGGILNTIGSVYVCQTCGHSQTKNEIDPSNYYDTEYKTLSTSAEEDDLYGLINGRAVYRNQHMAAVLSSKLPEIFGDILDYGCGKSLVMKHYIDVTSNTNVYLYDISEDYIKYWETFLPPSQFCTYKVPETWKNKFKIVTSFFSMEHVTNPIVELATIRSLLRTDGIFYMVVPNMYSANVADMIVVDHIQHYSQSSVEYLLRSNGFKFISADHESHTQASIYIADTMPQADSPIISKSMVEGLFNRAFKIAQFWSMLNRGVPKFENQLLSRNIDKYYIVGAGIIGTYIYLQIKHPENVVGFIDSNIFKQEKGWQGKSVFAPSISVSGDSIGIFVGLNSDQIDCLLPSLLPGSLKQENIWSTKHADSTRFSISETSND